MSKDFFDEEYEKKVEEQSSNDGWYSQPVKQQTTSTRPNRLYIVLVCIGLVLCIAFGWIMSSIVNGLSKSPDTEGGEILNTVIKYLKNNYYKDITDEQWMQAIETSGTALMQTAGDRYSQLMSPQTYYDFNYPTSTVVSNNEVFGVSFYIEEGIGLYVSSVIANSAAYGKLREGDVVLRLSDIQGYDGDVVIANKNFSTDGFVVSQWASSTIQTVLASTKSATFNVLRLTGDGNDATYAIENIHLTRSQILPVNSNYPYNFIEFYFDQTHNNISTPSLNDDRYTTYQDRGLVNLPQDTGYIRIIQFMDVTTLDDSGSEVTVSASDEFLQVMDLFKSLGLKRLVLDLKGNPGGNVAYVSDIASLLVTDVKLSDEDRAKVTNNSGELLITSLNLPKLGNLTQTQYRASSYFDYFPSISSTCDIVVWTDGNSASGSELLTGTLRDYRTAVQMGTTTYGKGIAQTWEELPFTGTVVDIRGNQIRYPWAIYYTCARYFSPLGDNIHDIGYKPDAPYDGLSTYADLWQAALSYWGL